MAWSQIHEHINDLEVGTMFMVNARKGVGCSKECRRHGVIFVGKIYLNIMKKLLLILIIPLFIAGCSATKPPNNVKVQELEQKIIDLQSSQASTTATVPSATTSVATIETTTPKTTEKISKSTPAPKPQEETSVISTTKSNNQICQDSYGSNSSWNGTSGSNGGLNCDCKSGYTWNEQRTNCDIAPIVPIKTNDQSCQDSYGSNSNWSGTKSSTGGLNCGCKSGYQWNQERTQCIIVPAKTDDSIIKVAKCEAEKTQQAQMYQRLEEAEKQMTYSNLLAELDSTDPCGKYFEPDAISVCVNGHASLARSETFEFANQQHSKNQITIQNSYIACLSR